MKRESPNPAGSKGKPFTLAPHSFEDALRKILAAPPECVISDLSDKSFTLSFDTYVVAAQLSGSLVVPFGAMSRQYFKSASDAPFDPPAGFDSRMMSRLEFKFQGHNHFVICELKHKLT